MNKTLKIFIWIIVILIIGTESFLLIGSVIRNNQAKNANNTLEQKLENASKENNQITTDYLLTVIKNNRLNIFDQFKKDINFKENEEQTKLSYAYWILKDEYDFGKGVSQDIFENLFKKVFDDTNFKHQNIICSCKKDLIIYDNNTKDYKFNPNHPGHGGPDQVYGAIYNKPSSLTISKNQYKLTVTKLFTSLEGKAYGNISTDGGVLFDYDTTKENKEDLIKKYEANYEDYKEKLTKYTYTFEKKDGKFYLLKYEIVV